MEEVRMVIPLPDLIVTIVLVTAGTAGIVWEVTKTATGWRLLSVTADRHDFWQFGFVAIHALVLLIGVLWAISTRVLMPIVIGAGFGVVVGLAVCWLGWRVTQIRRG
jgi:hypothetical protein